VSTFDNRLQVMLKHVIHPTPINGDGFLVLCSISFSLVRKIEGEVICATKKSVYILHNYFTTDVGRRRQRAHMWRLRHCVFLFLLFPGTPCVFCSLDACFI